MKSNPAPRGSQWARHNQKCLEGLDNSWSYVVIPASGRTYTARIPAAPPPKRPAIVPPHLPVRPPNPSTRTPPPRGRPGEQQVGVDSAGAAASGHVRPSEARQFPLSRRRAIEGFATGSSSPSSSDSVHHLVHCTPRRFCVIT